MKKTSILLFILLTIYGCENEPKATSAPLDLSDIKLQVDSLKKQSLSGLSGLDSSIFYFTKEVGFKNQRDEYEIKYLRTGNDRYRILGNRCVDSLHKYALKLKALSSKK